MTTTTSIASIIAAFQWFASAVWAIGVTKVYGEGDARVFALDDVFVEIEFGHFMAIMGLFGSGKSILLHIFVGLDRLTIGEVRIGDMEIIQLNDKRLMMLRRDKIGFIFQSFNLILTLIVAENIVFLLRIVGWKLDVFWVQTIVDMVGLSARLGYRPDQLFGGQQQRVAAVWVLVSKPEIIFVDEPTGVLDSKSGLDLFGFLQRAVRDLGQMVVMVTHDLVVVAYADCVLFFVDGDIVDEMILFIVDSVLDYMKKLGG